jgi:hypothetical protein
VVEVDFARESAFGLQFAAFYADCRHEVKPVSQGFRLCLVYNLKLSGFQSGSAPQLGSLQAKAAQCLQAALSGEAQKLIIPLDHQYSGEGLKKALLKGADRGRFQLLSQVATQLHCDLGICSLHWRQEGEAAEDYPYNYRRERGHSMGEVIEEEFWLDDWSREGMPRLAFQRHEYFGREPLEESLCEMDVHEATGNEGVTLYLSYRRAAIVMWPRRNWNSLLAQQGSRLAVPWLKRAIPEEAAAFAESILEHWHVCHDPEWNRPPAPCAEMLECLKDLGQPHLVGRFLGKILPLELSDQQALDLVPVGNQLGWPAMAPILAEMVTNVQPGKTHLTTLLNILRALAKKTERRPYLQAALEALPSAFEKLIDNLPWHGCREVPVLEVLTLLSQFPDHTSNWAIGDYLMGQQKRVDLREDLLPGLLSLKRYFPLAARLRDHCLKELQAASQPVVFPSDWRLPPLPRCCKECNAINPFLESPDETIYDYRAREDLRQHVDHQLRSYDMKFEVIKRSSPYILRCTKTRASFERRQSRYLEDLDLIAQLSARN